MASSIPTARRQPPVSDPLHPAPARTVLATVTGHERPPSLAEAAAQLGVAVADLDQGFGVVMLDPAGGLYFVAVDAHRYVGAAGTGPFANPEISPFGPEQKDKPR